MPDPWLHVGRLWTNGGPFLAAGAALRAAWQGFSNDEFGQVAELGPQETNIPVGAGRAVLAAGTGLSATTAGSGYFEAASGLVALVQASGPGLS